MSVPSDTVNKLTLLPRSLVRYPCLSLADLARDALLRRRAPRSDSLQHMNRFLLRTGFLIALAPAMLAPGRLLAQTASPQWFDGFSTGMTGTAVTTLQGFCGPSQSSGRGIALSGHVVRRSGSLDTRLQLVFNSLPDTEEVRRCV